MPARAPSPAPADRPAGRPARRPTAPAGDAAPARRTRRNMNGYDLAPEVAELIRAVNAFKDRTGRAFPAWSELLQILRDLGYEKRR
ncbi:MAG: hypothetical protein ACKOCB_11430 [Planctomycetia bacterium]